MTEISYSVEPIGVVHSSLKRREDAPMQADEGAPEAWLEIFPQTAQGLLGIQPGDELFILTWLHLAQRKGVLDVNQGVRVTGRRPRLEAAVGQCLEGRILA